MSYALKEIVKRTKIKPMVAKCVLLHMADMVREQGNYEFWESRQTTANHLGTDRKTIRRQLSALEALGVVFLQTERATKTGFVHVYMFNLEALLKLPCVDGPESRKNLVNRLIEEGFYYDAHHTSENVVGLDCPGNEKEGVVSPLTECSQPPPRGLTTPQTSINLT